jgi:hypothetical protein
MLDREQQIRPGVKVSRAEVRRLIVVAAAVAVFPFLEPMVARKLRVRSQPPT